MPHPKKTLTVEQIQQRVDDVIRRSDEYTDFASLLSALMVANDNLASVALAEKLAEHETTKSYGRTSLEAYRKGLRQPTYHFVTDLLALNPLHLRPVTDGDRTFDPQRILYEKTHLTEVNAASMADHNKAVMTRVENRLAKAEKLHWVDIMKEMTDFHMQGERMTVADIQVKAKGVLADDEEGFASPRRLTNIMQKSARATPTERQALYRYLQLDSPYRHLLETEVTRTDGKIKDNLLEIQETDFSRTLDGILARLKVIKEPKLDARQLEIRSRQQAATKGQVFVTESDLSDWRKGQKVPLLNKVRALLRLMESLSGVGGHVTEADVAALTRYAPYSERDLHHTAHQIIAEAPEHTADIHTLLKDIRASDCIDISIDGIVGVVPPGSKLAITSAQIKEFENAPDNFPNEAPLRELMARYNHILAQNNKPLIEPADIDKIVRISDHNRKAWDDLGADGQKERRTSKNWRIRVTPAEPAGPDDAAPPQPDR